MQAESALEVVVFPLLGDEVWQADNKTPIKRPPNRIFVVDFIYILYCLFLCKVRDFFKRDLFRTTGNQTINSGKRRSAWGSGLGKTIRMWMTIQVSLGLFCRRDSRQGKLFRGRFGEKRGYKNGRAYSRSKYPPTVSEQKSSQSMFQNIPKLRYQGQKRRLSKHPLSLPLSGVGLTPNLKGD